MSISLFKSFVLGIVDYITRHNSNYTIIETALNDLYSQMTGVAGGQVTVPLGLREIFDRRGLIGIGSYDFDEGTLSGPDYNFTVQPGAYWNDGLFYYKTDTTVLTMAGKSTGTYYINIDSSGLPTIGETGGENTTRQFSWNASTHTISSKTLYTGVNILFDGDDYADMLTSAARSKNFTKVADRLEEIEILLSTMVQTPASADTININCTLGGHIRITLDRATTTINFSGAYDGQKIVLELIQDVTGNRAVAFGAMVQGGTDFTLPAALSVTGNKRDFLGFIYSGGNSKYNYVSLARGY